MLQVTISHNKTQAEIIKTVDRSIEDVFKSAATGLVQITDAKKDWNGNTMNFSLTAKAGFLSTPIHGTVLVTDKDVRIDADLGLFGKFIGEDKAKAALESRVKGLLTSG